MAVEPVDMRRGIDGLSMILQQTLGNHPVRDRLLYFVIVPGIVSRCCYGMARESGYVSADCIRVDLFGRN